MFQEKTVNTIIALLGLAICLTVVNWSIIKKEKHLAQGRSMFVEHAPVDPRSLMQGDYMALNFKISNQIRAALANDEQSNDSAAMLAAKDGYAVVSLDSDNKASFKALRQTQTLSSSDVLVKYRLRKGEVKFATNAFFFQEGFATRYEKAKYGHFRVDETGELLLTSMHDENLHDLATIEK